VIILHTDEETILKRKQEVLPEELARQLECYKSIAEELGERAVLVDCGQELDVVTDEVLEVVLEALAERRR
jgi:thymidylate kinase